MIPHTLRKFLGHIFYTTSKSFFNLVIQPIVPGVLAELLHDLSRNNLLLRLIYFAYGGFEKGINGPMVRYPQLGSVVMSLLEL